MSFPRQVTRADSKLSAILSQMARLRRRLNSLAIQHAAFRIVAAALFAGAVIIAAANRLAPLAFAGVGAAAVVFAIVAILRAARAGWAMRADAARAAQIADERADLKGRLTTIVELAACHNRSALWPYVIEDALEYREQFGAAKIERRRLERSVWILGAAMIVAVVVVPLARANRPSILAPGGEATDETVTLDDLHLRLAEPGDDDTGLELKADAATMSSLRARLAREGAAGGPGDARGGIVNRARSLASRLQRKLRGDAATHRPRLTLKLADAGGSHASNPRGEDSALRRRRRGDTAGQFRRENSDNQKELPLPKFDRYARPERERQPNPGSVASVENPGSSGADSAPKTDSAPDTAGDRGEQSSNGGAAHGIGADPDSLFGAPSNSKMSTEGFEISIKARPMEHGAKGSGQAYLPPKVSTPLNPNQKPDEPIARTEVPAADRATIERVFER